MRNLNFYQNQSVNLQRDLTEKDIPYYTKVVNGESTIIIDTNRIRNKEDKINLDKILANYYRFQSLFNTGGFSKFLSRFYNGEIK